MQHQYTIKEGQLEKYIAEKMVVLQDSLLLEKAFTPILTQSCLLIQKKITGLHHRALPAMHMKTTMVVIKKVQ